jgi:hypothetical protein
VTASGVHQLLCAGVFLLAAAACASAQPPAAAAFDGTRALVLVDMIGDADLRLPREPNSTRWLVDAIWGAAKKLKRREFVDDEFAVEDDHIPFLRAGVPAVDIIDLDYPAWHTADDTMDRLSARSLQAVGDVLLAALPEIEARLR